MKSKTKAVSKKDCSLLMTCSEITCFILLLKVIPDHLSHIFLNKTIEKFRLQLKLFCICVCESLVVNMCFRLLDSEIKKRVNSIIYFKKVLKYLFVINKSIILFICSFKEIIYHIIYNNIIISNNNIIYNNIVIIYFVLNNMSLSPNSNICHQSYLKLKHKSYILSPKLTKLEQDQDVTL